MLTEEVMETLLFNEKNQKNEEVKIGNYQFKELGHKGFLNSEKKKKDLRVERESAEKKSFNLSPIVCEYRGINSQIKEDERKSVEKELERRVSKIKKKAFQEGYASGQEKGREEYLEEARQTWVQKISPLSKLIDELLETKAQVLDQEKKSIYCLIKNVVEWIALKEIKEDENYVQRLLEKLIEDLNTKNQVIIRVDKKNFDKIKEIVEDEKISTIKIPKARIEIDYEMESPGVILSTDNEMIDGTLKQQLDSLDELFSQVGLSSGR